MIRSTFLAVAILATATSATTAQQTAPPTAEFQPSVETAADLPAGAGRDETFYLCIACHGLAIIKRQGLSRDGWEGMIDLMVNRHGMAEPVGEERRIIVDYLAGAFPQRVQPGGGWRNPFQQ